MFPELCAEEKIDDVTTTTMNSNTLTSLTTRARRNPNDKGRTCCICAVDQTSLAGWYLMRNAQNEKVEDKYSCNRCYANFCRPGRPGRTMLPPDKIHQALTTTNGVIRYMPEVRTSRNLVANYTFSTSGPSPRPRMRAPKNKVVRKQQQQQQQQQRQYLHGKNSQKKQQQRQQQQQQQQYLRGKNSQKIRTEASFQSDDHDVDDEDDEDSIKCISCLKGNNPKKLVLCDGCDAGYHTYCVGLNRVPRAPLWFCPACKGKEMSTCAEENPCVACGCVDETMENLTPEPIKSIKCFCRLCFERYHANIRDENDGSRLPLFKLLDRVFDKLPMKIKSEEAKGIDNVTIGDKKNKWGGEREWEKRISSVSGLDTEAQVLSTCWLPPPATKVRVRVPVERFTPVDEPAVAKNTLPPPPRPRPCSRPPLSAPSSSEILKNVSRNNTKSDVDERLKEERLRKYEDQKERNRKAAARSRMRFKAISMLKELPKNKNKTDDELVLQLPIDLQPISNAGRFKTQAIMNMPSITLASKGPTDAPREERMREALVRSNGRKKFIKEMSERPEHKHKTEYELFAMLPKELQFRAPPRKFLGVVLGPNKESGENGVLSSKKRKFVFFPTPSTSLGTGQTKKRRRSQMKNTDAATSFFEERADEKAPSSSKSSKGIENKSLDTKPPSNRFTRYRPTAGTTELAHRDGRKCVTCGSNTTPYGDWYRTQKGNSDCKTYFCSRCAKIPENRMARGGVLTKRDLEHINNKKQEKNTNTTSNALRTN